MQSRCSPVSLVQTTMHPMHYFILLKNEWGVSHDQKLVPSIWILSCHFLLDSNSTCWKSVQKRQATDKTWLCVRRRAGSIRSMSGPGHMEPFPFSLTCWRQTWLRVKWKSDIDNIPVSVNGIMTLHSLMIALHLTMSYFKSSKLMDAQFGQRGWTLLL